jgi:two-component system chemotaxis sensor kinase CheA
MDDLIGEFLTETNESLEELDLDLVNLEQNPNDKDLLGKIFRLMHTIKGTCGFLSLPRLEKVAHHAENVLGRFRDGDLEVTPEYVTLIFDSIDAIKFIVGNIAETGNEPDGDDSEIIEELDAVYEGREVGAGVTPAAAPAASGGGEADLDSMDDTNRALEEEVRRIEAEMAAGNIPSTEAEAKAAKEEKEEAKAAPAPEPEPKAEEKPVAPAVAPTVNTPPKQVETLRVSVDVLENLMNMVSELVLTRNQLMQIQRATPGEGGFTTPLQRLNHVVSDLQEGVMKTRMQPIGNAWSKLPRIIRDLSMELGKKIDLEMIGKETELDRQVLELIKDPLTHMVRNSGDHGIEDPETRKAAGKPETGTIVLRAYHEGGHINIEIADDGKGLPLDKIKEKIIANGLATDAELDEMSNQQINQFIFKAGFSTAEKVTSVSGRGVGMDVVRTNIEKIGGSIELKSVEGKGSTFVIKIPLTLAIVSALIVQAGQERFAIPQLAVRELVMTSDTADNQIEHIKGTPVLRLRDTLLPLVSLSELLQLKTPTSNIQEHIETLAQNTPEEPDAEASRPLPEPANDDNRNKYIVVAQVGTYAFGIIVDKVFDTEEIVVKPVAKILRDIELFSGNTILGDGTVIMILDPNGIANATGEIEAADNDADAKHAVQMETGNDKIPLLLFRVGDATPKAVPLSLVARLETVKYSSVEHSGNKAMIQYRNQLMPLITFDGSPVIQPDDKTDAPILVFTDKDRSMGLIVDEIIDITEEHIDVQISGESKNLYGSAIIQGKATDVVDVGYYLASTTDGDWFKDHGDDAYSKEGSNVENGGVRKKKKILLVDDSPFFRDMLTPLLSVAGYDVTSLDSPIEALKICEQGHDFDLIVSDIEMPEMDGFEFAEKVKSGSAWNDVPMVALTSHTAPEDLDRGKGVGFSKYIPKFDRDTLLTTLSQTLSEAKEERDAQKTDAA